jgi:hypothetical protein
MNKKKMKQLKFILIPELECHSCGIKGRHVKTVHKNTAYIVNHLNYANFCRPCEIESFEYYADLWSDYWGSRF